MHCIGGLAFVTSDVHLRVGRMMQNILRFYQITTKVKFNCSGSKGRNQICHVISVQFERVFANGKLHKLFDSFMINIIGYQFTQRKSVQFLS